MTAIAKLEQKFWRKPQCANFTWDELIRIMEHYGYHVKQGSGSRVRFVKGDLRIHLHKPHPGNILKKVQLRDAQNALTEQRETGYE